MGSKRLKNESSQNGMKPIPLRPAHRADSDHIFTFSNGCRMRELSHSDHFPKQLKSQKKVNSQRVTWHSLEVTRGNGRSDVAAQQ
jgi:hypothetical protein